MGGTCNGVILMYSFCRDLIMYSGYAACEASLVGITSATCSSIVVIIICCSICFCINNITNQSIIFCPTIYDPHWNCSYNRNDYLLLNIHFLCKKNNEGGDINGHNKKNETYFLSICIKKRQKISKINKSVKNVKKFFKRVFTNENFCRL